MEDFIEDNENEDTVVYDGGNSLAKQLVVAEHSSPTRCQMVVKGFGQCQYESAKDTPGKCPKHSVWDRAKAKKMKVHNYRLQIWQERLDEFSESEQVKSLRGEIGVLRILLEQTMNKCKDDNDLILYSSRISDLATKISSVTNICDKLESKMGMMLDKSAALALASRIVSCIGEHVKDPQTLDAISSGIIDILGSIGNNEE